MIDLMMKQLFNLICVVWIPVIWHGSEPFNFNLIIAPPLHGLTTILVQSATNSPTSPSNSRSSAWPSPRPSSWWTKPTTPRSRWEISMTSPPLLRSCWAASSRRSTKLTSSLWTSSPLPFDRSTQCSMLKIRVTPTLTTSSCAVKKLSAVLNEVSATSSLLYLAILTTSCSSRPCCAREPCQVHGYWTRDYQGLLGLLQVRCSPTRWMRCWFGTCCAILLELGQHSPH